MRAGGVHVQTDRTGDIGRRLGNVLGAQESQHLNLPTTDGRRFHVADSFCSGHLFIVPCPVAQTTSRLSFACTTGDGYHPKP